MKRRGRVVAAILIASLIPRRAKGSVFGEENAALAALVAQGIEELTQLTTIIQNVRGALQTANEMLAIAREARRVYEMVADYKLADLERDAKAGLYQVFPDLREIELQSRILVDEGKALEQGYGPFFSRYTVNDARMRRVTDAMIKHAYASAIWSFDFSGADDVTAEPSPVERLIEERYLRTQDGIRRAVQNTGMEVLAKKVEAYVKDAESKDEVLLKMEATNAEVNFQAMRDTRHLVNLREQDVAIQEAGRLEELHYQGAIKDGLSASSDLLVSPGGQER
jgi:hypothetical protein